jgi:hypothetical protein
MEVLALSMMRRVWLCTLLSLGLLLGQVGLVQHGLSHDLVEAVSAAVPADSGAPSAPANLAQRLCDLCLAYAQGAVGLPSQWHFASLGHAHPFEHPTRLRRWVRPHELRPSIRGPPRVH